MSEFKYKIGDRVRIKSLDWYHHNKDGFGSVCVDDKKTKFTHAMSKYCGQVLTVDDHSEYEGEYYMIEDDGAFTWTDEMIEGLAEEETYDFLKTDKPYPSPEDRLDNIQFVVYNELKLPNGYIFKDENGNVINATKIVLEKLVVPKFKKGDKIKDKNNRVWYVEQVGKKHFDISRIPNGGSGYFVPMEDQDYYELATDRELPKTFEECVSVLEGENRMSLELMNTFRKLIDARNAYWKIYGEENGLGKPWEPDWKNSEERRYCIVNIEGDINLPEKILTKWILKVTNKILVFPTAEMRDAFYENFKEEIEMCKELL